CNLPCPPLCNIASAMIDRAELPVQRNKTLYGFSAMASAHRRHSFLRGPCLRPAELRTTLAALIGEIGNKGVHRIELSRIDHRTSPTLHGYKSGVAQAIEVKCQGVGRQPQAGGNMAGRHALPSPLHNDGEKSQKN